MRFPAMMCLLSVLPAGCGETLWVEPRVPIIRDTHGPMASIMGQAKALREEGRLMNVEEAQSQLEKKSCKLNLPSPKSQPLAPRRIWELARQTHMRVGYYFLCTKCKNWHLNVAGGYVITANGAVVTCYHVAAKPKDIKEGYLVAVTDDGDVLPVTAILAGNKHTDVCIMRVDSRKTLVPLPLNTHAVPGDSVWCYSDPANHAGFFSQGIINRFYQHWHGPRAREQFPVRMNVSVEWAPGSSGSAVIDRFGNAIGHVSAVSTAGEKQSGQATTSPEHGSETVLVFHDAVCAADVCALIEP